MTSDKRWKGWLAFVIVTAAAAGLPLWHWVNSRGIAPLVDASDELTHRTVEARLSGGFAYRPLAASRRGARRSLRIEAPNVMAVVARLSLRARPDASPETLRDAGLASLVAGDEERAVTTLEENVRRAAGARELARAIQQSTDSTALSDLAAAYLARAHDEESMDVLMAVNAAERAWELGRTAEIAWNRALALSATSAHEAAIEAWRDYLAIDGGSAWAAEARSRMNAISSTRAPSREVVKKALIALPVSSDEEVVMRAVASDVLIASSTVEDDLLPAWGAGDAVAFGKATRLARAAAAVSGDYVATDSVGRISALDPARAERARAALRAYGDGRRKLKSYDYGQALPLLQFAAAELEVLSIPLAWRAKASIATLHHYAKEPDRSLAVCAEVRQSADLKRFPTVAAQCAWNEGFIESTRRRFDRAEAAFETARSAFERMHDDRAVAAIELRLEENCRGTGDMTAAWLHMLRALRTSAAEPRYISLSEAARIADGAELPFAALALYGSALDVAQAATEQTDGHLARAQLLWRLGRGAARSELDLATRAFHSIKDRTAAARLEGELTLAQCTLNASTQPSVVVQKLESAIAAFEGTGNRRKIARARLLQAKAHVARRDPAAATRSLDAALTEIESQREQISSDEQRLSLIDTAREATELLVSLLVDQGRTDAALAAVERSKARLLLDAAGAPAQSHGAEIARPSRDEAFVEYFVLRDRVLLWTITNSGSRWHEVIVDRGALENLVDRFQTALISANERNARAAGAELYDLLLRDAWQEIGGSRHLIIAPDSVLHRVPFAALSPDARTHLIDDYDLANVPSFTWLAVQRRARASERLERVLVAAPKTGEEGNFARLTAAENDARIVATRFRGASVLTGKVTAAAIRAAAVAVDLFHFAGHAVADTRRPDRSALVLSSGELLRASEIARWPLHRARLVVLAACSTGAGPVTTDGTASLARAFLLAGSRSVVATQWAVGDEPSSELTARFYDALASGKSAGEALREAQRSVKSNSATYDWAAFQLSGSQ